MHEVMSMPWEWWGNLNPDRLLPACCSLRSCCLLAVNFGKSGRFIAVVAKIDAEDGSISPALIIVDAVSPHGLEQNDNCVPDPPPEGGRWRGSACRAKDRLVRSSCGELESSGEALVSTSWFPHASCLMPARACACLSRIGLHRPTVACMQATSR